MRVTDEMVEAAWGTLCKHVDPEGWPTEAEVRFALEAALAAAPQAEQEPVAWRWLSSDGLEWLFVERKEWAPTINGVEVEPLYAAPPAAPQWIACEERLPEAGVEVLVWLAAPVIKYGCQIAIDTWDEQHETPVAWSSATIPIGEGWDSGADWQDITHWMPLPAAPGVAPPPAAPQAEAPSQFARGIDAAARFVEKRLADYDAEHGSTDPDTGTREYPGTGDEYACELAEIAEAIRALAPPPASAEQPQPARIDPMQNPLRPTLAKLGPPDEHPAEEVLRKLACWLGVGGYNAPTVDADLFHRKIVDGIQSMLAERPAPAEQPQPSEPSGWIACDERMPEAGVEVLVWLAAPAFKGSSNVVMDTWDEQHEAPVAWSSATIPVGMGWDSGTDWQDITHWMPLPAAPRSER